MIWLFKLKPSVAISKLNISKNKIHSVIKLMAFLIAINNIYSDVRSIYNLPNKIQTTIDHLEKAI